MILFFFSRDCNSLGPRDGIHDLSQCLECLYVKHTVVTQGETSKVVGSA